MSSAKRPGALPKAALRPSLRTLAVLSACTLLALSVLAFDVSTPLGIAGGVLYALLVPFCFWLPWRGAPWMMATLGSALALTAFAFKLPQGELWVATLNRALSIAVIWGTAYLCFLQMLAARRLRDDEAELRAISDTAADAMLMIDTDGTIRRANAACEDLFGYAPEFLVGNSVSLLMPAADGDRPREYLRRYFLHTDERRTIGRDREVLARHRDGRVFPMRLSVGETWLSGRQIFIGYLHDLRGRRAAEQRIEQLQTELYRVARRCELGQMIGAIAHELNQPLAAVHNYIATALRVLSRADGTPGAADGAVVAHVSEVMTRALRQIELAAETLRQIRSLATRGDDPIRTDADLNNLVEETVTLALGGPQLAAADVHLELAPGLPPCRMNRAEIQQVLLNLVRNSLEAMADGERRELCIRTEKTDNDRIQVSVADSGPGLPEQVRTRLFMPFVTTKPDGIGIGLSIAHAIVESHGGRLSAMTNPGGGTIFQFSLPPACGETRNVIQ